MARRFVTPTKILSSGQTSNVLVLASVIVIALLSVSTAAVSRHSSSRRLTLSSPAKKQPRPSSTNGCEQVHIPMCRSVMPYSRTRMPNLLDHATQRNARLVLDQYQLLVRTGCGVVGFDSDSDGASAGSRSPRSTGNGSGYDAMTFYLCAVFAPICPVGFEHVATSADATGDEPGPYQQAGRRRSRYGGGAIGGQLIPPCRGVCERARAGCEPIMRRYNVSWPDELDCSRWPTQDRGVCIAPESIDWRRRTRADRGPGDTHFSTICIPMSGIRLGITETAQAAVQCSHNHILRHLYPMKRVIVLR